MAKKEARSKVIFWLFTRIKMFSAGRIVSKANTKIRSAAKKEREDQRFFEESAKSAV